jgi:glutathione S-transferase
MMTRLEGSFVNAGFGCVMDQDAAKHDAPCEGLLKHIVLLADFPRECAPVGPWLFDDFGWSEALFTPMCMRFRFVECCEGFELLDQTRWARPRRWRDDCLAHPAAQQVTREEIVELYRDHALGAGNGALLPERTRSSFMFEPHWRSRPWPPHDKWGRPAGSAGATAQAAPDPLVSAQLRCAK